MAGAYAIWSTRGLEYMLFGIHANWIKKGAGGTRATTRQEHMLPEQR
jgi:hypothetical protein